MLKGPACDLLSKITGREREKLFEKILRPFHKRLFVHTFGDRFIKILELRKNSVILTSLKIIICEPALPTSLMQPNNAVHFLFLYTAVFTHIFAYDCGNS